MKKVILLFTILFNLVSFAQEDAPEQPLKSKVDLPNFTPPSPEAFQITKYGDVPIDEYNGKVNLNIPLYQYQAGQLKVPIGLNYNAAGVKVVDIANQVGINWTLSAGGLITREIRDFPDEVKPRLILTKEEIINLNQLDCTHEARDLLNYVKDNTKDKEADIFNFNFAGYSGTFYLDDSFIPSMVKNEQQLKIEILEGNTATNLLNTKTFLITDPNGIKYYFGGVTATEDTGSSTRVNGNFFSGIGGNTSFYLYKIMHPVNGTIVLEYTTLEPYKVLLSVDYSVTSYKRGELHQCPLYRDSFSQTDNSNSILTPKYVSRIYSLDNEDEVIFNRTNIDNPNFKTVLNSISVMKNHSLFSKIEMDYSGLDIPNTPRFFLTKVTIDKELQSPTEINKKYQEYKMEYNMPEDLPYRLSYDVDILGYYNNANNSTLFPCNTVIHSQCPNREANFQYASKGVLQKIIYPTGGYTEFEYEAQPTLMNKYELVEGNAYINYIFDESNQSPQTDLDQEFIMPVITNQQAVKINLMCYTFEGGGPTNQFLAAVRLKITDITDPNHPIVFQAMAKEETKTIDYTFKAGKTYKIEIILLPDSRQINGPNPNPNYQALGSFSFGLATGVVAIPSAGVRIKKVTDYVIPELEASTKRFYYTGYDKISDIQADVFVYFQNQTKASFYVDCSGGVSSLPQFFPYHSTTLHSNYTFSDYESVTQKARVYPNVTVSYGGENFQMGGIERKYRVAEESNYQRVIPLSTSELEDSFSLPGAKDNAISLDGLLLQEKTFKNINGSLFKVQEKQFEYEFPVVKSKTNIFGFELYSYKRGTTESIRIIPFGDYGHTGPNDPLNPDYTSLSNQNPSLTILYTQHPEQYYLNKPEIRNYLYGLFKSKLIEAGDPITAYIDSEISASNFSFTYGFSEEFSTANCILNSYCNPGGPLFSLSNYFIGLYDIHSYQFRKTKDIQKQYMDPVPANLIAEDPNNGNPNAPTQEQLESTYKKVITQQTYEYGTLNGLPTKITMTTSDSNKQMITKNTYAPDAAAFTEPSIVQKQAYQSLVTQNNIASPVQVELFENTNLLSKQRTLYRQWNNNPNHILAEIIQNAKATQSLEDRVVISEYDPKGNPSMVSYKNGARTKYLYNSDNQVIVKIENYKGALNFYTAELTDPCLFINSYPDSFVTIYNYDPITKLLTSSMDKNCKLVFYEYDSLHRLLRIRDDQSNILKEFDNNYKIVPQH